MKNEAHIYKRTKKPTIKDTLVQGKHEIGYKYYHRADNLKTVFIIHGGPGSNMSDSHNRYFSPSKYNVVQFDQRCTGKSTSKHDNILEDVGVLQIVEDIEALRKHLKIDKICLFGISWGGTLSLAYAGLYPQNVEDIMLLNPLVFESSCREWFFSENGVVKYYPEIRPYFNKITHANFIEKVTVENCLESKKAWIAFEATLAGAPVPTELNSFFEKRSALAVHYLYTDRFLQYEFESVVKNISKQTNVYTLHGANDIAVSPKTVSFLQNSLINIETNIIEGLGHSAVNNIQWNKIITDLTDKVAA